MAWKLYISNNAFRLLCSVEEWVASGCPKAHTFYKEEKVEEKASAAAA